MLPKPKRSRGASGARPVGIFPDEVRAHAELIASGHMLCLDPSSGSQGSLPGFAIFEAGVLKDAGVITLPRGTRPIANRLWLLRHTLETEFERPDLLAVEWIAPVIPTGKGTFLHKSAAALIKSVGAVLATWDVPVIEPKPTTWHTMTPPGYIKSDARDAQMLGWCALTVLARLRGEPDPLVHFLGEHADGTKLP